MKRGGGKRKGGNFERQICEKLSRMIQPNSDETLFWRSAMSGGRATVRHRAGKKDQGHTGDITCTHPDGHWLTEYFFLECKFYRNLGIQAMLLDERGPLLKFWRTARKQARRHSKEPVLIAKENRSRILMLMTPKAWNKWVSFRKQPEGEPLHGVVLHLNIPDTYVLDFEKVITH